MGKFKNYFIGAFVLVLGIAIVFIYLYFKKQEIIYNPLDNPEIVKVLKKDSIERIQIRKTIDSIGTLYSGTQNSIDSITKAIDKKISVGMNALFVKWKNEKERISKLTESQLEEEINNILNEPIN